MLNSTSNADTNPSETQDVEAPQVETTTTEESSETPEETTTTQPSLDELLEREKHKDASLKRANKEAKDYRIQLEALKKSQAELLKFKEATEAEKLTADEKQERARQTLEQQLADLQKRYDDTSRQSQERIVNYEVRLQAARMGIVDPDVAAKLLDWSEIEYGDNGSPTNVEDLLKGLLDAKPYLKAQQGRIASTSGGATNPSRSTTSSSNTAAEYVKRIKQGKLLDPEYQALPAEMKKAIQSEMQPRRR